ncbi:transcriptional regulator domain-containing protein [Sphingomonas fennica]|uniref:transcriptional regulator domain-containing protein n=1 Tax=Edaphosphingomonas fennica TaxID=114404 RepID=UPI003CCC3A57
MDTVVRRGRQALAWEVLRRNPGYRAAFRQLTSEKSDSATADPAFAADWGLHFPRKPRIRLGLSPANSSRFE